MSATPAKVRPSFVPHRDVGKRTGLRIAFIHPDLGIGGAERLVVDAVVGLQKRGHTVEVFTSHHEDGKAGRSFEETRDGTLKVHVLGASIIPASVFGRFTIVCAILRQLHLSISFLLATTLFNLTHFPLFGSLLSLFLISRTTPFESSASWSPRRQLEPFDVIIVDQLSATIPLLRWIGQNRVVFYCHFPDLLLSSSRGNSLDGGKEVKWSLGKSILSLYRLPVDYLEEATTGEADKILVNSMFTSDVFEKTFAGMGRAPRVVYPAVDVHAYGKTMVAKKEDAWLISSAPTLISINRFEGKKDIALALDAFSRAREEHKNIRLIVAGGYDPRLADNVSTLLALQEFATALDLTHYTYSSSPLPSISSTPPAKSPSIIFLLNMSSYHKSLLLSSSSVVALLYTPSFEHLGIVPLEAMASGIPVLTTDTGGPVETVIDAGLGTDVEGLKTTGLHRIPSAEVWATALKDLLSLPASRRAQIGVAGKERAKAHFSVEKLAEEFEKACKDAIAIKRSILEEVGTLKMVAFVVLGTFTLGAGCIAYYVGPGGGIYAVTW